MKKKKKKKMMMMKRKRKKIMVIFGDGHTDDYEDDIGWEDEEVDWDEEMTPKKKIQLLQ
jgi:hypothetical protein